MAMQKNKQLLVARLEEEMLDVAKVDVDTVVLFEGGLVAQAVGVDLELARLPAALGLRTDESVLEDERTATPHFLELDLFDEIGTLLRLGLPVGVTECELPRPGYLDQTYPGVAHASK